MNGKLIVCTWAYKPQLELFVCAFAFDLLEKLADG
jgi:hypothetical protein